MSPVDDYLAHVKNAAQQAELQRIRAIIQQAAPDTEEVISYGMPAFRYKRKYLIGYCNFKDHLSIFPGSEVVHTLKAKLTDFVTSKGTIQFTQDKPLPDELLQEIIRTRIQDIDRS